MTVLWQRVCVHSVLPAFAYIQSPVVACQTKWPEICIVDSLLMLPFTCPGLFPAPSSPKEHLGQIGLIFRIICICNLYFYYTLQRFFVFLFKLVNVWILLQLCLKAIPQLYLIRRNTVFFPLWWTVCSTMCAAIFKGMFFLSSLFSLIYDTHHCVAYFTTARKASVIEFII